jgi:hypothetical protein
MKTPKTTLKNTLFLRITGEVKGTLILAKWPFSPIIQDAASWNLEGKSLKKQ